MIQLRFQQKFAFLFAFSKHFRKCWVSEDELECATDPKIFFCRPLWTNLQVGSLRLFLDMRVWVLTKQTSAKIVRKFATRGSIGFYDCRNFSFTDSSLTDAFTWLVLAFTDQFMGLANIKLQSKSFTLDPKDYWVQVKFLLHQMAAIQLSELCSKNPLKFNRTQIILQVQLSR